MSFIEDLDTEVVLVSLSSTELNKVLLSPDWSILWDQYDGPGPDLRSRVRSQVPPMRPGPDVPGLTRGPAADVLTSPHPIADAYARRPASSFQTGSANTALQQCSKRAPPTLAMGVMVTPNRDN